MTGREYLASLELFGIKLGLEQIRALVQGLGFHDWGFQALVVAGTNGKGSVTVMLERALRAAGHRTGRYTSPHLVRIEERIALGGQPIDPATFDASLDRVRAAAGMLSAPPTFFEATTAIALDAFRQARVDVAVCEVGLGGRLDATNVLSPIGVGMTAIDFDHEQHLGSTIEAIAREKAGVVKTGGLCVLGRNGDAVRAVVEDRARSVGAALVYAPDAVEATAGLADGLTRLRLRTPFADYGEMALGLRGRHQIDNAILAVRLLEELSVRGSLRVSAADIRAGLTDVDWPARLQLVQTPGGAVLIDGAHNPGGARALADYVQEAYGRRLPFVIAAMRDKQIDRMIAALAECASAFVCTASRSPRALSPVELAAAVRARAPEVPVSQSGSPMAALADALSLGNPAIVAGSLYLAGEILAELP